MVKEYIVYPLPPHEVFEDEEDFKENNPKNSKNSNDKYRHDPIIILEVTQYSSSRWKGRLDPISTTKQYFIFLIICNILADIILLITMVTTIYFDIGW